MAKKWNIRRVFALLMAVLLCATMNTPAMAARETDTGSWSYAYYLGQEYLGNAAGKDVKPDPVGYGFQGVITSITFTDDAGTQWTFKWSSEANGEWRITGKNVSREKASAWPQITDDKVYVGFCDGAAYTFTLSNDGSSQSWTYARDGHANWFRYIRFIRKYTVNVFYQNDTGNVTYKGVTYARQDPIVGSFTFYYPNGSIIDDSEYRDGEYTEPTTLKPGDYLPQSMIDLGYEIKYATDAKGRDVTSTGVTISLLGDNELNVYCTLIPPATENYTVVHKYYADNTTFEGSQSGGSLEVVVGSDFAKIVQGIEKLPNYNGNAYDYIRYDVDPDARVITLIYNREIPVIEPPVVEPPVIEPPVIDPPVIEPPVIEPPVIEPPVIEPPVIEPPVIEPPVIEPPVIEPPVIEPPVIEPPVIEPPVIEPPVIEPPVIEPPVIEPPVIEPPVVEPPVIEPPVIEPPVIEPPVIEPPVIEPPVIEPPVIEPPVIEPPVIEPPVIEPPVIEPPVIEPPVIEPPVIEPPVIEPPVIEPPVIEPPVIEPPVIEPPVIDPPEVDPPVIDPPEVDPPVIDPPEVDPPVIDPPEVDPPEVDPPEVDPPEVDPPEVDPPVVEPPVVEPPVVEPPVVEPPVEEPVPQDDEGVEIPEDPHEPAPQDDEGVEIPEDPHEPAPQDDDGLIEIPDEDVPLADVPKTGDPITLYAALAVLCGGGMVLLRKKEDEEE